MRGSISKLKQIKDAEERSKYINECLDKMNSENLDSYGLSN